jgi:hypothetical protein
MTFPNIDHRTLRVEDKENEAGKQQQRSHSQKLLLVLRQVEVKDALHLIELDLEVEIWRNLLIGLINISALF